MGEKGREGKPRQTPVEMRARGGREEDARRTRGGREEDAKETEEDGEVEGEGLKRWTKGSKAWADG